MSSQTVFVAGATGAIGRPLCLLLVAGGWRVVGTTRKAERAEALRKVGVEPVVVDVFDTEALTRAVVSAKPSAVIHQLTDLPERFDPAALAAALDANARLREVGTKNLADACAAAGVQSLVTQSIAFAYEPGHHPNDESVPLNLHATDPAAARTAQAVATMESLTLRGPWRGVVLRYGRLYGPGTWADAPSKLGCAVHVDAAAKAAVLALNPHVMGVFNVVEPDGTTGAHRAVHELGWRPTYRLPAARRS